MYNVVQFGTFGEELCTWSRVNLDRVYKENGLYYYYCKCGPRRNF